METENEITVSNRKFNCIAILICVVILALLSWLFPAPIFS
jgi:hypothetical protein